MFDRRASLAGSRSNSPTSRAAGTAAARLPTPKTRTVRGSLSSRHHRRSAGEQDSPTMDVLTEEKQGRQSPLETHPIPWVTSARRERPSGSRTPTPPLLMRLSSAVTLAKRRPGLLLSCDRHPPPDARVRPCSERLRRGLGTTAFVLTPAPAGRSQRRRKSRQRGGASRDCLATIPIARYRPGVADAVSAASRKQGGTASTDPVMRFAKFETPQRRARWKLRRRLETTAGNHVSFWKPA
jgi:hypothetical protein